MKLRLKFFLSVLIFLTAFILIGQNLDKPLWGEHDWNGVRYGNIARNYLRYGLVETELGQVENSGPAQRGEFEYYTHYPPLLPMTIGLSYKIFGIDEWSTRLIPTLAIAGSIVLIFLIGSSLSSLKIGVLAALLAMLTPMSLYFGKNASHEPLTLTFILLSFYGYLSLGKLKVAKLLFILGLVLAQFTAWAGYFLIPAITIVTFAKRNWSELKRLIPYWFLSFGIFALLLLHVIFLTGSISGGNLFESLWLRTGLVSDSQPQEFNFLSYLNRLRLWFSTTFTLTLMLLSVAWLIKFIAKPDSKAWSILILGIIGIIYTVVFSNAVFIHNYLLYYFLPFLAITGACTVFWLKEYYDRLVYHSKVKKNYFTNISSFIILLFLALVIFERRDFLHALQSSQQDKLAVDIGKAIKEATKPEDLVLISPLKFSYSADKFLRFYGDRKIQYGDNGDDWDVKVIVDQENGKFEIIPKETR